MWPWAHGALGYLLYTLWVRVRTDPEQDGLEVLVLTVGTQVPDVIDKPLAWYLHVLPYGRSLAHSILFGGVATLLVALYLARRDRTPLGVALLIGYVSHLIGDAYHAVLTQEWSSLGFLVWPLAPMPATETEGLLAHLMSIEGSPFFLFGLLLTGVAAIVWIRNEMPGLSLATRGRIARRT